MMFHYIRNFTVAVSLLASAGTLTAGVKTPEPLFLPLSLNQALVMAAKQKRVVFVDFCTAWCGACKKLDEDTWSNGKVIEQLKKKTIPIKLDADQERIIINKYNVKAYPTLLFLNADGSVLASIVGYQIPAQFIKTLQGVLAGKNAQVRGQRLVVEDH
jgi:thiol:disulfide interchange protein